MEGNMKLKTRNSVLAFKVSFIFLTMISFLWTFLYNGMEIRVLLHATNESKPLSEAIQSWSISNCGNLLSIVWIAVLILASSLIVFIFSTTVFKKTGEDSMKVILGLSMVLSMAVNTLNHILEYPDFSLVITFFVVFGSGSIWIPSILLQCEKHEKYTFAFVFGVYTSFWVILFNTSIGLIFSMAFILYLMVFVWLLNTLPILATKIRRPRKKSIKTV